MYEDEDSDCLDFGGDSDDDRGESDSSEDDLDVLLRATPEKRRHLQQQRQKQSEPEDDFEREMNAELQETVSALEAERTHLSRDQPETSTSGHTADSANTDSKKYYDNVYFDSDEDEKNDQGETISPSRKRPVPSNDDLLYDPNMDAEDEKWITEQRQRCRPKNSQSKKEGEKRTLPRSDAVLDCPACMTTLCRDCQRHDVYDNQYRAMFVTNCVVDTSELLKFPEQKVKKKKKKSKQGLGDSGDNGDNDKYNPVKCRECNTVVAMYDRDEIYHFFNVLASYS